jgi:hypothetical protein
MRRLQEAANVNQGLLLRGADLLAGGMVEDIRKGKPHIVYYYAGRETTAEWGFIRQLRDLRPPGARFLRLASPLEARLESCEVAQGGEGVKRGSGDEGILGLKAVRGSSEGRGESMPGGDACG